MTIVFLVITAAMIIRQSRKEGNWINLISVLMAPYFFIVLLNNFFIYQFGFYRISDEVLLMLTGAFILFYTGSTIFGSNRSAVVLNKEEDNEEKLKNYNIGLMTIVLYIIAIIALIKLFFLYRAGQFNSANINEAEGVMSSGIVGHLLLVSYSILPIVFLYWTYHIKKIQYLIPILLIMIVTFSTLIKYHIIGIFVVLFLFTLIYRKSLLKRAIVLLVIAVLVAFIGNYALTFGIRGTQVSSEFYLGHLWTYIGGSVIYDDYIFTTGVRVGTGIVYKLMSFLCALPNMFLNRLIGETIFPHVGQPQYPISTFGEHANVVDAIGYLFPSKGDVVDILIFGLVIFLIGMLFSYIYSRNMRASDKFNTFIAIFLCYFVFFSFFGTFYVNSGPWELLIYSLIIPLLFDKRKVKIIWR